MARLGFQFNRTKFNQFIDRKDKQAKTHLKNILIHIQVKKVS